MGVIHCANYILIFQLKVVCIDSTLAITHEFSIDFDKDLPEFG